MRIQLAAATTLLMELPFACAQSEKSLQAAYDANRISGASVLNIVPVTQVYRCVSCVQHLGRDFSRRNLRYCAAKSWGDVSISRMLKAAWFSKYEST